MEKEYFVIYKANCTTGDSNVIGITDDEEFAKSMQGVFCGYEKVKFLKKDISTKIKELAETYHDRVIMTGMSGGNSKCDCCGKPTVTRTCIEHDSQDFSKDLWICSDCYCEIVKYWEKNNPDKVSPI